MTESTPPSSEPGPTAGGPGPAGGAGGPEPTRPPETRPPAAGGSGLEPNVAGALSYLLGPITGVLFLLIDKERPFVRFHAMQSIVLSVAWVVAWIVLAVVGAILGVVPVLGWIIGTLLSLAVAVLGLVLWLYLMFQAFQGNEWEIPYLGPQARKYAAQVGGGPPA